MKYVKTLTNFLLGYLLEQLRKQLTKLVISGAFANIISIDFAATAKSSGQTPDTNFHWLTICLQKGDHFRFTGFNDWIGTSSTAPLGVSSTPLTSSSPQTSFSSMFWIISFIIKIVFILYVLCRQFIVVICII